MTANEYLKQSEEKLASLKKRWNSLASEAPQKIISLIKSGIKPEVSSGYTGNTITVNLNFIANTDAAKAYVDKVKIKIDDFREEIKEQIRNMDAQLKIYWDQKTDSEVFYDLVQNLTDWIDYISQMRFSVSDQEFSFNVDKSILEVRKKWNDISSNQLREEEAKKYGIALEDLDKHKLYLAAPNKIKNAKTSKDATKVKKELVTLKGYLDSEQLVKKCEEKIERLLTKEAEEKRIAEEKKAEEERLRKEKEEQERIEKEKQIEENKKIVVAFRQKVNQFQNALAQRIEEFSETLKAELEVQKEKTAIALASHKQTLENIGTFKFSEKKTEKQAIASLENKLLCLNRGDSMNWQLVQWQGAAQYAVEEYRNQVEDYLYDRYYLEKRKLPEINQKEVDFRRVIDFFGSKKKIDEIQKSNLERALRVLAYMKQDVKYSLKELMESAPAFLEIDPLSDQYAASVIGRLLDNDLVERTFEKGRTFFMVDAENRKALFERKAFPQKRDPNMEIYTEKPDSKNLTCPEPPAVESIIKPATVQ